MWVEEEMPPHLRSTNKFKDLRFRGAMSLPKLHKSLCADSYGSLKGIKNTTETTLKL